jgi:hypothetical protein
MRTFALSLLAGLLLALGGYGVSTVSSSSAGAPSAAPRAVNAVLGNQSFRAVHGRAPRPNTPERLRLQTHLAYVEALLRSRDRPSLTDAQRARRAALLDHLHTYWTRGTFPRNTEVPGRSPVFIDEEGRLCAVGALIAATAGRGLAERIDARYHLADVREMEMPAIDRWATRHGVTRRELAMIQPGYCGSPQGLTVCPPPRDDQDASALEVTALSASVGASLLNGVLLERGAPSVVGGTVGLVGGGTGLALGLRDGAQYPTASSIAGATSVVLGGWALVQAIRGDDEGPSASAPAQSSKDWSVAPASVPTRQGPRPGLRDAIRF